MTPEQPSCGEGPILLPKGERPPIRAHDSAHSPRWSDLIRAYIHPAKIAIFEAMQVTGQPLSATELSRMSSDDEFTVSELGYHLGTLAKIGLLEETHQAPRRGALETFYFFDPDQVDDPR